MVEQWRDVRQTHDRQMARLGSSLLVSGGPEAGAVLAARVSRRGAESAGYQRLISRVMLF